MKAQLALRLPTWGGRRRGAGRKPKGAKAGVSHTARPPLSRHHPVQVTLRVRGHVWNLRAARTFGPVRRCFAAGRERFGFRLVHHSVQGNHLHLIVEAADKRALARGMQGLAIRIAKALNSVMGRTGKVFADHYHAHALTTPRTVRNALVYVLQNAKRHALQYGRPLPAAWLDPFSSAPFFNGWRTGPPALAATEPPTAPAQTWLLSLGWKRHGLIGVDELPRA